MSPHVLVELRKDLNEFVLVYFRDIVVYFSSIIKHVLHL